MTETARQSLSQYSTVKMSYPAHIKSRAPEINLPYPRSTKTIIYEYFIITGEEGTPRKVAICKTCQKEIRMMHGSNV